MMLRVQINEKSSRVCAASILTCALWLHSSFHNSFFRGCVSSYARVNEGMSLPSSLPLFLTL